MFRSLPARLQLGFNQRKRARCQLSHTLPCCLGLFPQFYPRGSCDGSPVCPSVVFGCLVAGGHDSSARELKHTHAVIFTTAGQNRLEAFKGCGTQPQLQVFSAALQHLRRITSPNPEHRWPQQSELPRTRPIAMLPSTFMACQHKYAMTSSKQQPSSVDHPYLCLLLA